MPKISVVVCVYNEELCLLDALRSIKRNNIYKDVEVIIVNDCSEKIFTKRMLDLLSKLTYYKVIHSGKNLGLSNSRNLGFQNATAEYIAPLDADDTFPAGALDKIYNAFINNPKADFVYGDYELINLDIDYTQLIICNEITKENTISFFKLFKNWILLGTTPCKKKVWEKVGGYSLKYANTVQDYDFWVRAFKYNLVGFYLAENIYCWSRSTSGMNETFDRTDYYFMQEEHYSFLKNYQNEKKLANSISEGFYKHQKLRKLITFNIKHLWLLNFKNIFRPILLLKKNLIK